MSNKYLRHICTRLLLVIITYHLSLFTSFAAIPKDVATHFCQLFIYDGNEIAPLSIHARRLMTPNDSLSAEQLFMAYIFRQERSNSGRFAHTENWQVLRIFPHTADDGTVTWYAPADNLPAFLGKEHQKYICEVMPRLSAVIQTGDWKTADEYINKMIEYQCRFGATMTASTPAMTSYLIYFIIFILVVVIVIRNA